MALAFLLLAQLASTGLIAGRVTDAKTGQPLAGVTVVAQGPLGEQAEITDDQGHYEITGLAPGVYVVRFYYANVKVERANIQVVAGRKVEVSVPMPPGAASEEVITICDKAPAVDIGSSSIGTTISRSFETVQTVDPLRELRHNPNFNTESYARIDESDFVAVAQQPLSTFSIDVDTASYGNVRRFLAEGQLPPKDAVRIEELVNYFTYEYAQPSGSEPFSVASEVGPAPWNPGHRLLALGLRGRPIDVKNPQPRNLTFLIDVSGSMDDPRKLPLVKAALTLLVDQLTERDRVAIVVYAGNSGLVLPPTSGADKPKLRDALARLEAGGSTNGGEGIQLAYATARKSFVSGGINRVILATDGDFNVGITSEGDLTRLIEQERQAGIFLTVLGFGMGNLKDATMEKLADRGNGNYAYIDSILEARKVLVSQAGATLETIAKDVKLQVEWNPVKVASYRLIGYENRLLRDQDFNDDRKDAGDMGAGHMVTALYEIVPAGAAGSQAAAPGVDPLKYQAARAPTAAARSGDLATVKIRWKRPSSEVSELASRTIGDHGQSLSATSNDFRFAAAVAGFGMLLRASPHKGNFSYGAVETLARAALGPDREGYRREFLRLVEAARVLAHERTGDVVMWSPALSPRDPAAAPPPWGAEVQIAGPAGKAPAVSFGPMGR
ncbi:MAG TPA: von Willebrand factor type A domain-containing protein [Polyangia bacterium]|nr:von Willebrand factor type A domain-containing protein [Polyangia bacterium]